MRLIKILKHKLPYIISLLAVLISINITIDVAKWKDKRIIESDVISYYAYLPATFIYHDYTLQFLNHYDGPHKFTIWPKDAPNGGKVIMTSMGMSFLYAPFFFAADYYAMDSKYDAGGYSEPYHLAINICALCYFIIGLFFLCKLLLNFFNPFVSALVILITTAGSNLFYYATYEPGLSHVFSFSLITMFIWYTIKWYEKQKPIYTILLGILIGLISLIRPTNIIVALFFILYDIKSWNDAKNRIMFFLSKFNHIALILTLCFFIWLPQFLYWKSITGSFLYYSYGSDSNFFFNNPQIFNGFFSYRNGWLIYSPAMIFSVLGMFFLWKKQRALQIPLVFTFLIFIYVIFSWWCWWYGGSFGSRSMIDIYGLLALSTGTFFTYINSLKFKLLKFPVFILSLLLTVAGVHHINKRRHFSIHYDSMTKEAFWDNYLNKQPSPTFESKLRAPDYIKATLGINAYEDETK
ncbi:MAG: hypothetical protein ACM3O3_07685 [Syntrophothermus sp.]